jgi:hypothetical protein
MDINFCFIIKPTPVDGQKNCPKNVEFHAKLNLGN